MVKTAVRCITQADFNDDALVLRFFCSRDRARVGEGLIVTVASR